MKTSIDRLYKKANQCVYFVRKLKKCHVDSTTISIFYKPVVESVLTFCMICSYGVSSLKAKSQLKRIVSPARRIGCDTSSLQELYEMSD